MVMTAGPKSVRKSILILFCLLFISCQLEPDYEYTWVESSGPVSMNVGTFSKDGIYTKAVTTKSSNSIHNCLINYNGQPITDACGFEGEVKFNSGVTYAGYEWFTSDSGYDMYIFEIYNDGRFVICTDIDEKWNTLLTVPAETSGIKKNDFNTLKVISLNTGDIEVYINGNLKYKIMKDDLAITPGKIARAYCAKRASSSNPANAWFRLIQYQKIK